MMLVMRSVGQMLETAFQYWCGFPTVYIVYKEDAANKRIPSKNNNLLQTKNQPFSEAASGGL